MQLILIKIKSLLLIIALIIVDSSCRKVDTISQKYESSIKVEQAVNWPGRYFFQASNREGLTTSFDISITDLNNITVVCVVDSEKPETYKNVKAIAIEPDKIRINFNADYGDMGIIDLEKTENDFLISGKPVYYINPGSDSRIIRKIN